MKNYNLNYKTMKALEPKNWHLNRIPKWSVRIESEIHEYYTFEIAYTVAAFFDCVHTIQYKLL